MTASVADDATLTIKRSLIRELGLLETRKRLIEEEIKDLEHRHKMKSKNFLEKFEAGELANSQYCFEWWGLIKGLDAVKGEIRKVETVLSS